MPRRNRNARERIREPEPVKPWVRRVCHPCALGEYCEEHDGDIASRNRDKDRD